MRIMQAQKWSALFFFSLLKMISSQMDFTTCGQTKGCFMMPNGCNPKSTCSAVVGYRQFDSEWVELELMGKTTGASNNNYVALGFSQDQNMAKTPVTECSSMNGAGLSGKLSYNDVVNTRINEFTQDQMNATLITDTALETNGRIYCKLRQKINPGIASEKIVNLNQSFFLLLAVGETNVTVLTHHYDKTPSEFRVSPLTTQSANPTAIPTTPGKAGISKGNFALGFIFIFIHSLQSHFGL